MLNITSPYGNANKNKKQVPPYLEWLIFKTLTIPNADETVKNWKS